MQLWQLRRDRKKKKCEASSSQSYSRRGVEQGMRMNPDPSLLTCSRDSTMMTSQSDRISKSNQCIEGKSRYQLTQLYQCNTEFQTSFRVRTQLALAESRLMRMSYEILLASDLLRIMRMNRHTRRIFI